MTVPTISIIGTGAVARALALAHVAAGGRVEHVVSRDLARALALASRCGAEATTDIESVDGADAVLVAVSDRAVPLVCARLARSFARSTTVFLHTSGAVSGRDMADAPVRAGSLHPLQAFPLPPAGSEEPDAELAARVPGSHWFHEGDGEDVARRLVAAWGGHFHALSPGSKALYHAGAAILSNHTVALFAAATQLFEAAGIAPDESRAPLATLLAGTTANLAAMGTPAALTGPVSRGDVGTIEQHLAALRSAAPDLVASYTHVALLAVGVAHSKGSIDDDAASRLRALLSV